MQINLKSIGIITKIYLNSLQTVFLREGKYPILA